MKRLRLRILALLGALPILLGLLVPAVAAPCAAASGADTPAMTCDFCLVGVLPGAAACAAAYQTLPGNEAHWAPPSLGESPAWFDDLAGLMRGLDMPPDYPPPR